MPLGGLVRGVTRGFGGTVGNVLGIGRDIAGIAAPFLQAGTSAFGIHQQAAGQRAANEANIRIARENREFNAAQAAIQRAFESGEVSSARAFNREMANTSYRRAMADMRAAGLNPILAYRQGGAPMAFSPAASGTAASGSVLPVKNVWGGAGQDFGRLASSALEATKLPAEVRQLEANVEKQVAETHVARAVKYLRQLQADLTGAQIRTEENRPAQVYAQAEKLGYDVAKIKKELAILDEALKQATAEGFSAATYEAFLRRNPWLRELEALFRALGLRGGTLQ